MERSLGFIEISGVTAAIDALDIMCKTADVELVSWERKLGGRLVTLIVRGNVSAVTRSGRGCCGARDQKARRKSGHRKSAFGNGTHR